MPPFIGDEFLARELSRHGKLVSPNRKLLSGCRSPLLRHVVSHRRQVHMILNIRAEEFNYRFVVRVDDFDYVLFATSSALKCFNCGEEGHLARVCPSRPVPDAPAAESAAARSGGEASVVRCGGAPAVPDEAQTESKAEGKGSECVRVTEMRFQATLCFLLQLIFEHSLCTHLQVTSGSSLELPCLSAVTEFITAPASWTFNGVNLSAAVSDSVRIKRDGLYLSISPITAAHQGQYACLVKYINMDIVRTYDIAVIASFAYDINAAQGSTIYLPCYFPHSSQILANALWYKETGIGQKTLLHFSKEPLDELERVQQIYPLDQDQSVKFTNVLMEDSGTYRCESPEGEELSVVRVTVKVAPTPVPYSCGEWTAAWNPCHDQEDHTGEAVLQESMAEFSMKLYSFVRESQLSNNLLLSPLSISALLSHLLLGARDITQRAIERALAVPHDFSCVHFQMAKLREKLASSLQMSSQIYYHPKMILSESFTNQSIQFYESVPTRLLETSEENTYMINSWVANKTNNKIQHLVDSVSPSTQLMFLNAVSFKGQWKLKFNLKPRKALFSKLNGDLVSVPVFHHRDYLLATMIDNALKAQVGRFALTGDSSLYILLPNAVYDLQLVEDSMTYDTLRQMMDKMKTVVPQKTEVTLPQIKLDVEPDMLMLMKKLGLSSLFEDANLCGLYSEDRLVLDDVRHRGLLALTEHGVEAVAVTSTTFSRTYNSFSALHPFIFLLWSDRANVPLFVGRVVEP
ncbi:plasma protease C1 inhibitor [Takifugu flavidus]|uniref:plasma protease C1 inhibitor n=1 Tax=Takifugu flavidus TaxID=433684 RepID=UPI0025445BF4|nr:plasma protease C1 inhibitor [Takifugu flavidus]